MDKLTAVSGLLFLVADALALASLAHPEWLRSIDVPSGISLGLLQRCVAIRGRPPLCGTPELPATWAISLGMIGAAVAGLAAACGLTAFAFWRQRAALYARWVAFWCCHSALPGRTRLSCRLLHRSGWWSSLPLANEPAGWAFIHPFSPRSSLRPRWPPGCHSPLPRRTPLMTFLARCGYWPPSYSCTFINNDASLFHHILCYL